ncbi:MAG: hydrogenase [Pseudomonadota bacterium]
MPTCKECKHVTPAPTGDPAKGVCIQQRTKLPGTQKTSTAIKGKMINKSDEACEHFEGGESWKDIKELL